MKSFRGASVVLVLAAGLVGCGPNDGSSARDQKMYDQGLTSGKQFALLGTGPGLNDDEIPSQCASHAQDVAASLKTLGNWSQDDPVVAERSFTEGCTKGWIDQRHQLPAPQ